MGAPINSFARNCTPTSPCPFLPLYSTFALFAIFPCSLDGFSQTELSTASSQRSLLIREKIPSIACHILPLFALQQIFVLFSTSPTTMCPQSGPLAVHLQQGISSSPYVTSVQPEVICVSPQSLQYLSPSQKCELYVSSWHSILPILLNTHSRCIISPNCMILCFASPPT